MNPCPPIAVFEYINEELRSAGLKIQTSSNEFAMISSEKALLQKQENTSGFSGLEEAIEKESVEILAHGEQSYNAVQREVKTHVFHPDHSHSVKNTHFNDLEEKGRLFRNTAMKLVELKRKGESGLKILELQKELATLGESFLETVDALLTSETEWYNRRSSELTLSKNLGL